MIPLLWASNFLPVMFSLDSQQPEAIQIILLKSTERGTTPRRDGISTLIPQRVNPTSSLRRGLATVPVAGRTALASTASVGRRFRTASTTVAPWTSPRRPCTRCSTTLGCAGLGCVLPKNRERSDRIRFIGLFSLRL